jgi:hypothetical protein
VFDPIFSSSETEFLEELGYSVSGYDFKHENLILYMPHCEHWLCEQVLSRRNSDLVLIGNSLRSIESKEYPTISSCIKNLTEYPIKTTFDNYNVWNNTSIHLL